MITRIAKKRDKFYIHPSRMGLVGTSRIWVLWSPLTQMFYNLWSYEECLSVMDRHLAAYREGPSGTAREAQSLRNTGGDVL